MFTLPNWLRWSACLALSCPLMGGSAHAATSNAFNPDTSVNFLGLVQRGTRLSEDRTQAPHNGISLQEVEVQFLSDVDPYLRASALLSIAPSNGDYAIDPEEVFVETISLPSVTLRAGKFKTAIGKHNQLHTHAFPFIDAPLIHQALLGNEGLNEPGVSASALLPIQGWFSEVTVQAISLGNQSLFNSPGSGSIGGVARFKNLFDLNDDWTLELGVSGAEGKNTFEQTASVFGADLTFKWRPAEGGKYHALIWSTEYLSGNRPGLTEVATGAETERLGGIASWIQYQFAERWWVQARAEFVGLPRSAAIATRNKQSALLGFFPSEFSGFRLQYDHLVDAGREHDDHALALQYNISIGAHPAHAY